MNPTNITELLPSELRDILNKGQEVLTRKQLKDLMLHHVLRQNVAHLTELNICTDTFSIDWNFLLGNRTLLGHSICFNLPASVQTLLTFTSVRKDQCGSGEFGARKTSPAVICIERGMPEMFLLLVNTPLTNVNTYFENDRNVLYYAIKSFDTSYLDMILQRRDLDVNCRIEGKSAINLVIDNRQPEHLEMLLTHPLLNLKKTNEDMSPLNNAIVWGHFELVALLLCNGADPEEKENSTLTEEDPIDLYHTNIYHCCTVLSQADAYSRLRIGQLLLDMGIRPTPRLNVLQSLEESPDSDEDEEIVELSYSTGKQLYNQLRTSTIRPLATLARGSILRSLRNHTEGRPIKSSLDDLLASLPVNFAFVCKQYLQ